MKPFLIKQKLIKNQRGVTLLEVVLAVAILLAVSIPVTRAIATSAKFQYKSRVRQKLTAVSENFMESFKGYSLEEMETKFNERNVDLITGCVIDTQSGFSVSKDDTSGKIEYQISDVSIDNQRYDILATVNKIDSYDNLTLAEFDDFDKVSCAYAYIEDDLSKAQQAIRDDFEKYIPDFLTKLLYEEKIFIGEKALTRESIDFNKLHLLKRKIIINIAQHQDSFNVTYGIEYTYDMKNYPYNADEYGNKGYLDYGEFNFTAYSGKSLYSCTSKESLKRAFIYFLPLYVNNVGSQVEDSIEINNSAGSDIQVFLLKQNNSSLGNSVTTYEQSYCPYVTAQGNSMNLYHNLQINIANPKTSCNDHYKSRISGFANKGSGEEVIEAIKTKDNTILYSVDIEIKKGDEVWSKLSSTLKK